MSTEELEYVGNVKKTDQRRAIDHTDRETQLVLPVFLLHAQRIYVLFLPHSATVSVLSAFTSTLFLFV